MKFFLENVNQASDDRCVDFTLGFNFKVLFNMTRDNLPVEEDYYEIGKFVSKEVEQYILNHYVEFLHYVE